MQLALCVFVDAWVGLNLAHSLEGARFSQLLRLNQFHASLGQLLIIVEIKWGPLGHRVPPPFGELVDKVQLVGVVQRFFRCICVEGGLLILLRSRGILRRDFFYRG